MRKFVRNWGDEVNGKFYSCPLLRLPEVYLNMAEAMNELGKATTADEFGNTAYDYLNMTRNRAGMPDITKKWQNQAMSSEKPSCANVLWNSAMKKCVTLT